MTPANRDRIVKLLGLLGSEHDGERAAAGLAADRLRHQLGATWDDLVAPASSHTEPANVEAPMDLGPRERDLRDLERCEGAWWYLTPRQRELVAGFLAYLQTHDLLTARQREVLDDIVEKANRRRRSA